MSLLDKASLIVTPNAYKASKLYSVVPSTGTGDMDVVRATTATRVNSLGLIESVGNNIPRIDYTNGSCPSLLVEPQRTNLFTYSNDFSNSDWDKLNSSTITFTSSVLNPEGSGSYYFTASNSSFGNILRRINTFTIGQTHTVSFFVKKGNYRYVGFRVGNSINVLRYPTYDFDTDTLNKQGVDCAFNRTILNNGWVRVSLTFTQIDIASVCDLALVTSDGDVSTALSGGEFVYIYGAQLELASYPTSYIPTVASTVTRNADVISKSGISSLIGQTEGTLFSSFYYSGNATGVVQLYPLYIGQGTFTDSVTIGLYDNALLCRVFTGGVAQNYFVSSALSIGNHKVAFVYANNNLKLFLDGVLIASDTSASIPTCSQINIGSSGTTTLPEKINVNNNLIYKTALTDTECITLTTL